MNNTEMNGGTAPERWIAGELNRYREHRRRLAVRLGQMQNVSDSERLTYSIRKGKRYYSELIYRDGVRRKRYIGNESKQEVAEIKEKRFLKAALKKLDERISMLEKGAGMLVPVDPEKINEELPEVYRLSPEKIRMVFGQGEEEAWYESAVAEKARMDAKYGIKYRDDLKHMAKDGTRMRSKSEVLIANEFISRGIPYVYEMPVFAGNILMHPDFCFYSYSRGRVMLWEHAGKLGDSDYMTGFSDKMDTYIRKGFVPCVDILFTFDTKRGDLDTRMIDAIIDEYR